MNYLSHIYLSGQDEDIIIGNFLGDYVKGHLSKLEKSPYNKRVLTGIALHRQIDSYTDAHPIVRKSTERLKSKYHKFSGIIVDMYYDHIFAKNFHQFSDIPLTQFSQQFYELLARRSDDIPAALDRMVVSMTTRDWLSNYATLEGLSWALRGIASRLKFVSGIENATDDLVADYHRFEEDFMAFFPEVQAHSVRFLEQASF